MLSPSNIRTSGAYVLYEGMFVFQVGPTMKGDKLGVVRLGGHREGNETAFDTAKREVYEEAHVEISFFNPNTTFHLKEWNEEPVRVKIEDSIPPILIKGNEKSSYTAMYLSKTSTPPSPSSESKGLLLLTPEKVQLICKREFSLKEFQELDGVSILKSKMSKDLILQPFPQLLFLSRLLKEGSELMGQFMSD